MAPRTTHPCARTTARIRRRIRSSPESTRALAARYGINRKTVLKWRHRSATEDAPCGRARERVSTVLSTEQEAIIVGFRKSSLLPLDDCLYALKPHIPHLTRASLHRCLVRHHVGRLPRALRTAPKVEADTLGRLRLAIGRTRTGEGMRHVFVAIDLASRLFVARAYRRADQRTAALFLRHLAETLDYRIRSVVTLCNTPADRSRGRRAASEAKRLSLFQRACAEARIEHEALAPDLDWTAIQEQRLSDLRISYRTNAELEEYLRGFSVNYNFRSRLKCLKGLTPYQFICRAWAKDRAPFARTPYAAHQRWSGPRPG
jgi:hypothetical protein